MGHASIVKSASFRHPDLDKTSDVGEIGGQHPRERLDWLQLPPARARIGTDGVERDYLNELEMRLQFGDESADSVGSPRFRICRDVTELFSPLLGKQNKVATTIRCK